VLLKSEKKIVNFLRALEEYHWNKLRTPFETTLRFKNKYYPAVKLMPLKIKSEIDVKVKNVAVLKVAVIHKLDLRCSP
jgi:hypothetical protein